MKASQPAEKRRGSVLIVDDDPDGRWAVRALLEAHGFSVIEAGDGKAALELMVSGEEPAMVVLDLEMPVMSGRELLSVMQSYHRLSRIPVLVCSGSLPPDPLPSGPIVDYLRKPYEPVDLLARVLRCVAS